MWFIVKDYVAFQVTDAAKKITGIDFENPVVGTVAKFDAKALDTSKHISCRFLKRVLQVEASWIGIDEVPAFDWPSFKATSLNFQRAI